MTLRSEIKGFAGRVAGATGLYARNFRSKMTIVAFHRINDQIAADGLTCDSQKFEAFCDFFSRYFRVTSLSRQVAGCNAGEDMGGTISITFDDGYLDNFEVAAPILKRRGLPATFFVTTAFVGTTSVAPWDKSLSADPGWMAWGQLRDLLSQGFEIGSHTDTHINLGTAGAEAVRAELVTSRQRLNEELGITARLFAYPFGGREHISEQSRLIVRESGFDCCVACYGGVNPRTPDPYYLNRISIADWFATPDQFGLEFILARV
jgi:peptidoglycan/xylan/chitin deacetylase (PgdA/CDA1 family)